MKLYGAVDLHVTVLMDEKDKVVYQKRLANDLPIGRIPKALEPDG